MRKKTINTTVTNNDKLRLEHLENLLELRRGEYTIFGKTSQDQMEDDNILLEIKHLRMKLYD